MIDQYLAVRKERQEWLGERYFRLNHQDKKAVQVCINSGADVRKGKSSVMGVYTIGRLTLMSNYMAMNYVEPITKRQFEAKFNLAVKMLK